MAYISTSLFSRLLSLPTRSVAAADGAHLQYLTFDEFDVIVFRKDPDFGHPVVLVYVEASFLDPDRHVFLLRFGRNHRPGY
jgi:hypothetical protein